MPETLSFHEKFTALEKKLAAIVFPLHIPFLDKLNANAAVRGWMRKNRNLPVFPHRFPMYDFIASEVIGNEPIDYIEFGVFKGETIRRWSEKNTNPQSRFFGFDSFVGLPEFWTTKFKAGDLDVGGKIPDIADERVAFVKGWFQDTLPGFLKTFQPRSRLVVHHDSDLYTSVMYCLTMMNDIMPAGTVLIFDEFSSPMHEFRAFNDYVQSYKRAAKPLARTALFAQQAAFLME